MTWVERVDRASPLKGELEMSTFAAILPRHSLKRVSVSGGWELPFRGGSEKGSAARGGARRSGVFFGIRAGEAKTGVV
jgi:hypothetical protein